MRAAPVRIRRDTPEDCLPLISQESKISASFPEGEALGAASQAVSSALITGNGADPYGRKQGNPGAFAEA